LRDKNCTDDKYQEPANRELQSENTKNQKEKERPQKCCPGQTCELAQIFATVHDGPPQRRKSDSSEAGLAAKSRSGIDQATTAAHADSPPSAKNTQRYAAINAEAI